MPIEPYLFFNGRCEEAVEFYRRLWTPIFDAHALQGQSGTALGTLTRRSGRRCPSASSTPSWTIALLR
jgi:hypothetical protein